MNSNKSNNNNNKNKTQPKKKHILESLSHKVLLGHLVLTLRHPLGNLAVKAAKGHYGKAGINLYSQIYVLR